MKSRAQSILEYAILASIIAVAVVGMGLYLRRSVSAGLKITEQQANAVDWKMGQIAWPHDPYSPEPQPSCEEQCANQPYYYLCMTGCQASMPPETTP